MFATTPIKQDNELALTTPKVKTADGKVPGAPTKGDAPSFVRPLVATRLEF